VSGLIEKCNEFRLPLFILMIDFEKAFDSVEYAALFEALRRQSIPESAIRLLHTIYTSSQTTMHIGHSKTEIDVLRGVRQGDTISPKLFSACLQLVFERLNWDRRGIKIDGVYLSNLRFADDIALLSHDFDEIQAMAAELEQQARAVGLRINVKKTKLVCTEQIDRLSLPDFAVAGQTVEAVDEFIYLGQVIGATTKRDAFNQAGEPSSNISASSGLPELQCR
jgi:hypothetical protein